MTADAPWAMPAPATATMVAPAIPSCAREMVFSVVPLRFKELCGLSVKRSGRGLVPSGNQPPARRGLTQCERVNRVAVVRAEVRSTTGKDHHVLLAVDGVRHARSVDAGLELLRPDILARERVVRV